MGGRLSASRSRSDGWVTIALLSLLGVVVVLSLIVGYCLANPATLKPLASYVTERFLDRTLVIDGEVELEVSLTPRVTARDVRFGNADWADNPDMATADLVMAQIDLRELFDNRVHLLDVDVTGAALNLEDRIDGRPNWVFFGEDASSEGGDWSFMIQGLTLEDLEIFADIGELAPIHLEIPALNQTSDLTGNMNLVGHGLFNGRDWRVNGRIGSLDELLEAGWIQLDLNLVVDDATFNAEGDIGDLATLSRLDLSVQVSGSKADVLGEIFGLEDVFRGDIALTIVVKPRSVGHALSMSGHVAEFDVQAEGTVLDLGNLDGWDMVAAIKGPEAAVFGKALQVSGLPEGPFEIRGQLHLEGGDLDLTDVDILTSRARLKLNADFVDFPRSEGAFGNLHITGPDISLFRELLNVPTLPQAAFELNLSLDANGSQVASALKVGTHTLSAEGSIGEFPTFTGTRLTTDLDGGNIAEILRLAGLEDTLSGAYQSRALLIIDDTGLSASDIAISTGPFQLKGSARLPDFGNLNEFTVTVDLAVSDLAEAGDQLGIPDLPVEPVKLQAALASTEHGFQLTRSSVEYQNLHGSAEGSLGNLRGLNGLDLHVEVSGRDIEILFDDAVPTGEPKIPFTLSSGVRGLENSIDLIGFTLRAEGGSFVVDGRITTAESFVGSHLVVTGQGRNLAGLLPKFSNYTPPQQAWNITAEVNLPDPDHFQLNRSKLHVGSVELALTGTLDTGDYNSTDLLFEASGDSFKELGQYGEAPFPEIPFDFSIKLDGTANQLNITRFEALWGESDLSASGFIGLAEKPMFALIGTSTNMNVVDLEKALFGEPEDLEPEDDASRIFPDTPILIGDLMAFDADVDVEIEAFHTLALNLNDITLKLKVDEGAMLLERMAYRDRWGRFDATAVLRPQDGQVGLDLKLIGNDVAFNILTAESQAPETIPRYDLDVAISGTGSTVAELAGGLNGKFLVSSDGGRINNTLLDAFTGDFLSNVLDVLNPFVANEPFTPMECMVLNATIEDGMVDLTPGFVMRTNRVNMFVFGKANLATERLDLSLATQARRGIGISAASLTNPYFKVGGQFASPALQLDPTSAAVAASVATATAGLSIIIRGVWDRLMGERNPCPEFLKHNRPEG